MYYYVTGYVQGMSDLLSPILMQMGDEIDTFWCFAGLMEMEQGNFELVQHFMKSQLKNLGTLLKFIFPRFYHYLGKLYIFRSVHSQQILKIIKSTRCPVENLVGSSTTAHTEYSSFAGFAGGE